MGSLYLNLEGVSSETAGTIANEVARHYFEQASVTPETALLRSVRHAYRYLYDARLEDSLGNIGLTALVMCKGRASIAQVLPTQFYLIQEGELTALPETQERLDDQSARPTQEGRYPQWEPPIEMFRATLYPQDVAVLCSDNIGAALSDNEVEDTLSDGKIQTVAESLIDTVRKRGERDASVLALQFVDAEETLQSTETVAGEPAAGSGKAAYAVRPRSGGNAATAIIGIVLALVIMAWSLIASLFGSRSQAPSQPAPSSSSIATQSTIVTRSAANEARRQRFNRIAAGIVVLLGLVLLVIGANAIFGGDDTSSGVTEDATAAPEAQQTEQESQTSDDAATPSPTAPDTATATPAAPAAPESGSVLISEQLELVLFSQGEQPGNIYGLNNTMYFLDTNTGAVYSVGTAGNNEVVYQPGPGGIADSRARFVTGRVDAIQILNESNQLFQVSNGAAPQVVELPTGSIQQPVASATYDENYYLLDVVANDVLRFRPVGSGVYAQPEGYFGINSGVDLSQATDLAIDGTVFIMFSDGTISRYSSGTRAEFDEDLATLPSPIGLPGAIFISQGMGSLYILDGENDRVVQVTTEGLYQRQLSAPNRLFANATDIFVNSGETYLWVVGPGGVTRLPLPDLPEDAPRSQA